MLTLGAACAAANAVDSGGACGDRHAAPQKRQRLSLELITSDDESPSGGEPSDCTEVTHLPVAGDTMVAPRPECNKSDQRGSSDAPCKKGGEAPASERSDSVDQAFARSVSEVVAEESDRVGDEQAWLVDMYRDV